MKLNNTIDVLYAKDIVKRDFKKHYILGNKPAVIKGLMDETLASESWTLERMTSRLGDNIITVFDKRKANGTSFVVGSQRVPLRHMFDLIKDNQPSDLRVFVNPVLKKDKALAAEFPCPEFFKGLFQLPGLIFLGGKGTVVPLHFDFLMDDGLLTQLFGRKEIIMVPYNQSRLIYRLPFNTTSLINLFDPDYVKYPALHKVHGFRVILEHGDTLFIPSGYWHQLKYVDASMSVGFRRWLISFSRKRQLVTPPL